LLAPYFTVYNYDRRGRGDSGDKAPFAVEREIEDIEALINTSGQPVYLFGLSSGAALALEAAIRLGSKVQKIALYEAPYNFDALGHQNLVIYTRQLAGLLAVNDRSGAAALFMQFVGNPPEQIDGMRQSPVWQTFEAVAPTLAYDGAFLMTDQPELAQRSAGLVAPVLVMNGSASPSFMEDTASALAALIPHAHHLTLEGQRHDVDMEVLAPTLVEFFNVSDEVWLKVSSLLKGVRTGQHH
jgi:pimeloyl-ACP methyl ester carboxylesterase